MMFLGESFLSSSQMHDELWPVADAFTDSTVFAIALRRWLAAHLGCEPTREAVTAARDEALRADPVALHEGPARRGRRGRDPLGRGVSRSRPIPADEFAATIGVTVHRVTRLEPWILQHRDGSFDDLVSGVEDEATEAAADPNCVAYKSIVAYRTGLDVGDPSPVGGRGGVRAVAGRRLGRDEGAREAGPRLPDPPDARGREGERPAVPLPLRRRRPRHQPRVRGPEVDVPAPRRRPGPAGRPRPLRLSLDPRGRLHRVRPAERLPRALGADPLGVGAGRMGARDARRDGPGGQAPLRLGRGGRAGGVLGVRAARPVGARARARPVRRPRLRVGGRGRAPRDDSCSATRAARLHGIDG